MKKFYFLFLFALIASIGNLYAAEVVLWEEDFSSNKLTGYVVGKASTRGENYAEGVAPELMLNANGYLQVTVSDLKGLSGKMTLTFKSNKTEAKFAKVTTSTTGVTVSTTPTNNSGVWTADFTVTEGVTSLTFKVTNASTKNGRYDDFKLVGYEAETKCATPTFNLENGKTYTDAQTLEITSTTADATIHYTINGGEEKTGQSAEFTENGEYTVDAWATKDGLTDSEHAPITFTIAKKCAAPTFTPAAGFLKLGNAITFTSATADAEVYYQYSYNGGEYNSFVKGTSFTPDKEGTYKIIAKATKTGFEDGVSEEQIYEVGNLVFYESFDKNDGTGGNDGKWSGNIAADDIQYDVAGWTFINAKGANKCARIGTGSKGTATTPALTGLDGDAVLTFKAGAWNIEKENTTLNISITNGTLDKTSVVLKKGEFTEYTINITRADATSKIKFEAAEDKNNRFFLDEVKVVAIVKEPIIVKEPTATLGFTAAEINERPWLAANDIVLTEEVTEVKDASCVKLNCEGGAQIEYTLVSAETGSSTATVESGAEIVGLIKGEVYELTVCAVKGGYKSASRQYTFIITGSTSSVSSMSSEGVKVFAAEGGVKVVADEATDVAVYTAAGQLVRQARVAEGSTLVNVAPGFYVVRANGTATKVIVR